MTDNILAIIGSLAAGLPTVATIITALLSNRANNKHMAKQSILQMINEDKIAVLSGEIPSNYQNILNEYDTYHKNGGNSYLTEKVEAYKKWYIGLNLIDKKGRV